MKELFDKEQAVISKVINSIQDWKRFGAALYSESRIYLMRLRTSSTLTVYAIMDDNYSEDRWIPVTPWREGFKEIEMIYKKVA